MIQRREFGISRKTGYKILACYRDEASAALTDRPRRPVCHANQLPPQIEGLRLPQAGQTPLARAQIRELLIRRLPGKLRATPNALFNLSKRSIWWLRLGIAIERIKPGSPQQDRHTSACT